MGGSAAAPWNKKNVCHCKRHPLLAKKGYRLRLHRELVRGRPQPGGPAQASTARATRPGAPQPLPSSCTSASQQLLLRQQPQEVAPQVCVLEEGAHKVRHLIRAAGQGGAYEGGGWQAALGSAGGSRSRRAERSAVPHPAWVAVLAAGTGSRPLPRPLSVPSAAQGTRLKPIACRRPSCQRRRISTMRMSSSSQSSFSSENTEGESKAAGSAATGNCRPDLARCFPRLDAQRCHDSAHPTQNQEKHPQQLRRYNSDAPAASSPPAFARAAQHAGRPVAPRPSPTPAPPPRRLRQRQGRAVPAAPRRAHRRSGAPGSERGGRQALHLVLWCALEAVIAADGKEGARQHPRLRCCWQPSVGVGCAIGCAVPGVLPGAHPVPVLSVHALCGQAGTPPRGAARTCGICSDSSTEMSGSAMMSSA